MEIVDYGPLWETMRRNNVTQYQLLQSGIDNHTLDSLKEKSKHYYAYLGEAVQDHWLYAQ